jgi:hypothetical protein
MPGDKLGKGGSIEGAATHAEVFREALGFGDEIVRQ